MTDRALDPRLLDPGGFRVQLERVFTKAWIGMERRPPIESPGCRPLMWEPLGIPLVETRDEAGTTRLLSNVCTHRGALVVERERSSLRCRYHGRQFGLDGRVKKAPGFEGVPDFPGPDDHLPVIHTASWAGIELASIDPARPFADVRMGLEPWSRGIDFSALTAEPATRYDVPAHWALYCDNYLEGMHIPFVHPGLQPSVTDYRIETFAGGSVQIAWARGGEPTLAIGDDHPLAGQALAALYFWIFPATMVNVYPWGVSLNLVVPRASDRTEVVFQSLVRDGALRGAGAGADLHGVELEDEGVVRSVQQGVASPLYRRGRLAPAERAVGHFHEMLEQALR